MSVSLAALTRRVRGGSGGAAATQVRGTASRCRL
jgi:hypothetical protein